MKSKIKSGIKAVGEVIYGLLMVPVAGLGLCIIIHHYVIAAPRQKAKHAQEILEAGPEPVAATGRQRRPITPVQTGEVTKSKGWLRSRPTRIERQSQMQSRLFQLPAELRFAIWELAVGGNAMCVGTTTLDVPLESRLESSPSNQQKKKAKSRAGHCILHWDCTSVDSLFCGIHCPMFGTKGLLSLPLTCHQVYLETLPILYQRNAFTFHNHQWQPPPSIWRSGRFNLLVKLETSFVLQKVPSERFDGSIVGNEIDWVRSWRTIASLANLQHLTAYIQRVHAEFADLVSPTVDQWYSALEDHILIEPRRVTAPKTYILWLAWSTPKEDQRSYQSRLQQRQENPDPFEIRRQGPYVAHWQYSPSIH